MKTKNPPPRLAAWIFSRLFPDRLMYSTLGDIEEIFHAEAEARGVKCARRRYRLQVLRALPYRLLAVFVIDLPMFILSLKVMCRSLSKHKAFSFLTLLALTLGLTSFFLIFFYVRYESSYDTFHPDADRIFLMRLEDAPGESRAKVPGPAAHALETAIPEIEATTQTAFGFSPMVRIEKEKFETSALFVGEDFFRMFRFPLLRGSDRSFAEPSQVILTQEAVRRLFGTADPLGRTMEFVIRGDPCLIMVAGIMADPPPDTHFKFDILLSYPTTRILPRYRDLLEAWRNRFPRTYVKVRRGASIRTVEKKIADFLDPTPSGTPGSRGLGCALQPISDIHLRPDGKNDSAARALSLFFYLSVLVLAVAVINYVNLATSRSSLRLQEVGIRKTIGAGRFDLFKQFVGEAIILTVAAFVLASTALIALLPLFNRTMERNLGPVDLFRGTSGWEIAGILLTVGLAAGLYPALVNSSSTPARILRGPVGGKGRSAVLRNMLVVVQFTAAVILVIVTLFIWGQVRFIRNQNPGFERTGVVEAWAFPPNGPAAKQRLLQNPEVAGASLVSNVISLSEPDPLDKRWGEISVLRGSSWEPLDTGVFHLGCDPDFIPVFGLRIAAGRNFSAMGDEVFSAIVNESLASLLGPDDALGQTIRVKDREHTVTGVIKDFFFQPLYAKIGPVLLTPIRDNYALLYTRFRGEAGPDSLALVKAVLDEAFSDESHTPVFLGDRLDALYKKESMQAALLSFFSILAVVIAGLGILGLSAFSVERRTKEIGIRKVLGANSARLFVLLSENFAKLLAVANLLGWPVAFHFVHRWLSDFTYHIPVRIETFLWAAAGMLILTLLVSGTQILKITQIDPVETLKAE